MNVAKLLKQAEKLVSYGKVNDAIGIYQEILAEDFHNTAVHHLIADLYISKQDLQRASRHLFKVAADASNQGDQTAAIAVYRTIIKILPKNILAREKLMEIFSNNGSKSEIAILLPDLCAVYEEEGNIPKVIECLERLISLEPTNKSPQIKLALFLNERGMKEKAVEILSQIARDYLREDRYEEALAFLERFKAIDPKDKHIHLRIAELFERQGKTLKAIETIQSALSQDPSEISFLSTLAKLYVKAGRMGEAERIYEKLLSSHKSFLPEALPFVETLIANKKIDRAVRIVESLYQEIKDKEGRKRCAELLEEVLKLDPQNLDAYRLLEAFYSSTFQYDQLAITLLSHADAYLAKCDYGRALDLARQLVDLEPYNQEYQKKYQFIAKLSSSGNRAAKPTKKNPATEQTVDVEEDEDYGNAPVDANFDQKVSLVTDEDVENFFVDIELLEKFGQQANALHRLEQALKAYPHEIKLRQKLKAIYVERKMPKRAAQECLEIAKILQQRDQKEEANQYLREAQRLNPLLSSAKRTPAAATASANPGTTAGVAKEEYIALKGDLSEIGLLDVIQILDNAQKSGKLMVKSEGKPGTIFFNSGRIVNASYHDKVAESAMYALVAVKGGTFEYIPSATAYDVVINNSNTNLLLEGLRLLDEANRDQWEAESSLPEDPAPETLAQSPLTPTAKAPAKPQPGANLATVPVSPFLDEASPLEEL